MKLKTIEIEGKTYAEVTDGKPIFIDDDSKEIAFDAPGTKATITRLNGEAKAHREGKEAAESKLRSFEGITDPEAAKKALATVASLDQSKLIEAGKVDEIKAAAIAAVEERFKPIVAERDKLQADLYGEKIGGSFSRSKFVADKVAVPVHMLEKTYGGNFKIEDGKIVAYDLNGSKIYSRAKPGELADFEEALEHLVSADPFKDRILKGQIGPGGGTPPGGGPGGGAKTIKQSDFDALPAKERAAKMADGYTLTA